MTNTTIPNDTDLITSDEVLERLLSVVPLRRLAVTCVLPAIRCGKEWRYRRSDLEAWIARQMRRTHAGDHS